MKILKFNKKLWFILSLVFIGLSCVLMLLNRYDYNVYLEKKEEYVEVDCTVIEVDDIKHTIKVAYVFENVEYYNVFNTTQYKLQDQFTGVIRPNKPTELRFDNGYSFWNTYTYAAIILTTIALAFDFIIFKRIVIKFICTKKEKTTIKILEIKDWRKYHYFVVNYNGKEYKSELFKTFDNITLLEQNDEIDLYLNGPFHYIDLSSYKRIR